MNKKLLAVALLVAVLVAAIWWSRSDQAGNESILVLHGNVDIRQVELAFNASGRVDQVLVQEGDRVHKRQVLAKLDTSRLRIMLDQTRALAEAQRTQVAKFKAGSRPEEIRQAAAGRDEAQTAVRQAQQVYERQLSLAARNFVSQQQADSAKNTLDGAEKHLKAAEQIYRLAVLGPRKEDVASAEANLAAQSAGVGGLEHDIAEGVLYAPDEGIIENRVLEPGDMASPQKTVFTLALTEPVWVRIYLPEKALGRLPKGARAMIVTDSNPGQKYSGWLGYVSPTAEFTPKTVETPELRTSLVYQARIFVCDGKEALRQGMPVTVEINYSQSASQEAPCASSK